LIVVIGNQQISCWFHSLIVQKIRINQISDWGANGVYLNQRIYLSIAYNKFQRYHISEGSALTIRWFPPPPQCCFRTYRQPETCCPLNSFDLMIKCITRFIEKSQKFSKKINLGSCWKLQTNKTNYWLDMELILTISRTRFCY
jgi:hypothetical protein